MENKDDTLKVSQKCVKKGCGIATDTHAMFIFGM